MIKNVANQSKTPRNPPGFSREDRELYLRVHGPIVVENNLLKMARRKPGSLKAAINAMCFQCFGGTIDEKPDSGWR